MEAQKTGESKGLYWTGWVLSVLPAVAMIFGAIYGLTNKAATEEQFKKFQYPAGVLTPLIWVELACLILYLIPQTAVLGAILLTGYLGGATATHVRVGEPLFIIPIIVAIVLWLGIFLRDRRLRALVPFRT
jgi:hypothetical protein